MEPIDVAPDFKEFLKLSNAKGVRYLVVGGYAVAAHGYLRATGDIDLWIDASPSNLVAVREAAVEFGLVEVANRPELLSPGKILRIGMPPLRIELMTSIDGVEFEECYSRRQIAQANGLEVPIISLEDLIRNKLASGHPKDLADVDELGPS